jgi:SRSO17 transposase
MKIRRVAAHLQVPPSGRAPQGNLLPEDLAGLHEELVAYHAHFASLFVREEQRHWALKYLEGQLSPIERKSIEPMAAAVEGGNIQAMQQFISTGAWSDEAVLAQHQRLVAETLGDAATGVLIIDGLDIPKQGEESVGVARQWCGALGKVANCQASVVACYASRHGATLVDVRLYLPEPWFGAEQAARRQRCGVPVETVFRTRPQLAEEMIGPLYGASVLPFQYVVGDEGFGQNPVLLDQIAARDLTYLMEVPHSTRVWQERPPTAVPPATGKKGRPFTRLRLAPGAPPPQEVAAIAAQLPAEAWVPTLLKEGSKGPLVAQMASLRVVAVRDELPGPDVWLVLRRNLEPVPVLKTYLCNAPPDTSSATLSWLVVQRGAVEIVIREGKDDLGLDHYEVRGWRGWHHHLTMTLLAHHFLVRLRRQWGGKRTGAHRASSTAPLDSHPAPHPLGCRHGSAAGAADPGPELRRRVFPSAAYPPAPGRHVLS